MLDQLEAKETAANDKNFFKGTLDTVGDIAMAGLKVERLKKTAAVAIEDGMADARRMAKRGMYAAEDLVDDTAHRIKKDPFRSVGITFGVGLGLGAAIGWLIGHKMVRRTDA